MIRWPARASRVLGRSCGLPDDATEEQVLAAIGELKKPSADSTALQSSLAEIGVALGVTSAKPEDILAAAKGGKGTDAAVIALQSELASVTTELNTLKADGAKARATTFVDGAIKEGRVGVKPLRDHYIEMHMQDAGRVEKEIGAMPVLNGGAIVPTPSKRPDGEIALNASQLETCKALGLDLKAYAKTLKEESL